MILPAFVLARSHGLTQVRKLWASATRLLRCRENLCSLSSVLPINQAIPDKRRVPAIIAASGDIFAEVRTASGSLVLLLEYG